VRRALAQAAGWPRDLVAPVPAWGNVRPVQLPVTGHPLHTRSLTVVVTRRDDGRYGARGVVNDLRKCGFVPMMHGLQPAGLIHQMSIDLVLDPETRRIESLVTDQPFVAVEPSDSTERECCRDPVGHLQALVGEPIDGAFAKKLSAVFGGPRGCSHLLTLLQLMASGLPRALEREERLLAQLGVERPPGEPLGWRSGFLDGYEASDGAIELAVQLHDFHARPQEGPAGPLERFQRHDEMRVFARVAIPSLTIAELYAFERIRERASLASAAWQSREAVVAPLVGVPLIPGLAGRILRQFGDAPETELLRDALLQLAPGQIQVMAALTDRWFVQARENAARDAGDPEKGPPVGAIGGRTDSCWMWRSDGALARSRREAIERDAGPGDMERLDGEGDGAKRRDAG